MSRKIAGIVALIFIMALCEKPKFCKMSTFWIIAFVEGGLGKRAPKDAIWAALIACVTRLSAYKTLFDVEAVRKVWPIAP